jgi:hypothetical protein
MARDEAAWRQLWNALDVLERRARDLRRLSQEEPLRKARPDYPNAHVGRSQDDEVRAVFAEMGTALTEAQRLLPSVVRAGAAPAGIDREEAPETLAARLAALEKLTASLARETFEPLPALPPHAPPYLVTLPGHDLPGSKAPALAQGIDDTVASLRNAMLAAANEMPSGGR